MWQFNSIRAKGKRLREKNISSLKPSPFALRPYSRGFSLIEAMIATAIVCIGFVGVYTLITLSEQFTKWAIARQKLQLIGNQIFEVIEGDSANRANYTLNLATCTNPGASTVTSVVRSYEWCIRMQNDFFSAGSTDVRSVTVTTSGTKYNVLIRLEAYGAKAQIIMERVYGS